MYVRLLTGRYAGQERDIRADAANIMLRDGRAQLPEANGGPDAPPASLFHEAPPQAPKPAAKRKKA